MPNIQSDGIAEDEIRAFVQAGCAELHAKTILEKTTAQIEIADPNDKSGIDLLLKKAGEVTEEINTYAELRRTIMLSLFNKYKGDKDYWCIVKHLGVGAYEAFEAYQASEDDPELLNTALDMNKAFVRALSHFLGTQITDCSACFADMIKERS